jgi:sulfite exporter TauE/SafE
MSQEMSILTLSALSIGFFHTILGPDHYLPFIALSRSRQWSTRKTAWVTALCGIGHVLGSVILGLIGIALGFTLTRIEAIESFRGNIAAWALIAFGLVYFVWGVRRSIRNKPHRHAHFHIEDIDHEHTHTHSDEHLHIHEKDGGQNVTPWALFVIFLFGPCEPLIPLLMYPAAKSSLLDLAWVAAVFAGITVGTMLAIVLMATKGISFIPFEKMERYTHPIAGATIFLSGLGIVFLGL